MAYVTTEEFTQRCGTGAVPSDQLERLLDHVSREVDSLTYNRIMGIGFQNLTAFQQETIREVICRQVVFEQENADMIDSVLSGYSLNGASVQFGQSWNVFMERGVAMKRSDYALLCQTGLCCRAI